MGVYRSIRKMDLAADKMKLAKQLRDDPRPSWEAFAKVERPEWH